jgi:hypothetical protein
MLRGEEVRFGFVSTDATTADEVVVYDNNGNVRAIAATERLIINSAVLSIAAAVVNARLFTDANADGTADEAEVLLAVEGAIATVVGDTASMETGSGLYCAVGLEPKVIAANAGRVSCYGTGFILQG